MAKVRKPTMRQLVNAWSRRWTVDSEQADELIVGMFARGRVYDRSSGNFKAIGWRCEQILQFAEGLRVKQWVVIMDDEIREFEQTTL